MSWKREIGERLQAKEQVELMNYENTGKKRLKSCFFALLLVKC
jgi:hypothetical protein